MEERMGIDRYTKVILTIIAACLVWLSIGGTQLFPSARAQTPVNIAPPVQIARPFPTVIKGTEFGYRVDGLRKGEAPIGTLVVQIDGAWYEAGLHYQK
jgi:hypothetical protein